mmetsp:Transcript_85594/g.231989  ORF Transcript_85594/g.231989 Transcript_85594/m.231989 type:complete len:357 (+) Transcript_85594:522-1592(+)
MALSIRVLGHELAGPLLDEGVVVELVQDLDGLLDPLHRQPRIGDGLLVVRPVAPAQLRGLQEGLPVARDLPRQLGDVARERLDLRILDRDLLVLLLLGGLGLVPFGDGLLGPLITKLLVRRLRERLALQPLDQVLEEASNLHKVVLLRSAGLQRGHHEDGAPEPLGGPVEHLQDLLPLASLAPAAAQLQLHEGGRSRRLRPWGRVALLDEPVGAYRVDGLLQRPQLSRARERVLVPGLGLLLALGGQHGQELHVGHPHALLEVPLLGRLRLAGGLLARLLLFLVLVHLGKLRVVLEAQPLLLEDPIGLELVLVSGVLLVDEGVLQALERLDDVAGVVLGRVSFPWLVALQREEVGA